MSLFQVLNLSNVFDWMGEAPSAESDGFVPETMLCLPIFNRNKIVIGVAQLMNKVKSKRIYELRLNAMSETHCSISERNRSEYVIILIILI